MPFFVLSRHIGRYVVNKIEQEIIRFLKEEDYSMDNTTIYTYTQGEVL